MPEALREASPTDRSSQERAEPAGFEVALHVSIPAQVDLRRVPTAFGDDAGRWLGEPIEDGPIGEAATGGDGAARGAASGDGGLELRRYLCDLRLRVSPDGRALFRKSAIVALGRARRTADGWLVPIEWRAATLAPLFPVFAGRLTIGPEHITVDGFYAPPFGVVGYVLDRAVLSTVAHGTARWFLGVVTDILA